MMEIAQGYFGGVDRVAAMLTRYMHAVLPDSVVDTQSKYQQIQSL